MTPIRGWFARGERLVAKVPHGHWKTLTFVAGLRSDGICAPFVLDGPINAASFLAWAEQCLVPTLRPGDVVVVAKLKTLLRKDNARTVEDTWKSIGRVLDAFSPMECTNYLRNSGYVPT